MAETPDPPEPGGGEAKAGDREPPADGTAGAGGATDQDRSRRYDDWTSDAGDTTSARDREEVRIAVDELQGDVVVGNKTTFNILGRDGAAIRAPHVDPETITRPHLPASGFGLVENAVGRGRIVIVRGPAGTGKTAALLRALTGGSAAIRVRRMHQHTDLRSFAPGHSEDCRAFVMPDLTDEQVGQLDEYEVGRLRDELGDRWLGFTLSDRTAVPAALASIVVSIGDPPTATDVFEQHFRAAQPSSAVRDALLEAPDVAAEVTCALAETRTLREAAELAVFLATFHSPPADLAGILRQQRKEGAEAERLHWFDGLPSLRAHCTALSLAIFNGLAREEVTAQADRLVERIAPTPENQKRDEAGNPFGADSGVSPALLRASATRETFSHREGDVTLTALRYDGNRYPSWVLKHVWDEFDAVRPAVVAWLRDLGGHGDVRVRARCAAAVGVLAVRSFRPVLNEILGAWAVDPDAKVRRSAAFALSVASDDRDLGPTVARIVESWMADGAAAARRATAAIIVSETTDPTNAAERFAQLARLAEADDLEVVSAVASGLAGMLNAHGGALAGHVLHTVAGWMADRRSRGRRITGHLAFIRMGYELGDPTAARRDDPHGAVPTLLLAATRSEPFAHQLGRAWHGALGGTLARLAATSLKEWAEIVEKHPETCPIFVWLLTADPPDRRTVTIVDRAARSWIPDVAPVTGRAVLDGLTGVVSYG